LKRQEPNKPLKQFMNLLRQHKLLISLLTIVFFLSPVADLHAARKKRRIVKQHGCRAVILADVSRGKRLYGKNPESRILPASTTKIMTALLVLQKLNLDDYVLVGTKAPQAPPSKIDIKPGERYKVRDLLYALLLSSANDASIALAEAVAGSEYQFVLMMNQRAKDLGAYNTRFANSNGLPTKYGTQYSTAFDMYLIFRQALKYPFFRDTIKLKYKTIRNSSGRQIGLKNHNKMLFKGWKRDVYGKTGYTRAAGTCFVGTLQDGQRTLIIGVFDCHDRWEDIRRVITSYGGVRL
jgi:D-alanyl-D-alanine carboxypeptidase (penicillin-binding protein 5/6)